jgi:Coenzyme PQQ synthesis protein D (PqqD)
MTIPFTSRVRVPADVLLSNVQGESVLLNLKTETYFGLNEVGTQMWDALTKAESIQAAFDMLAAEYDVDPQELRQDLEHLLQDLTGAGLLQIQE